MTEDDYLPMVSVTEEEADGVGYKKRVMTVKGKTTEEAYQYYLKLKKK